MKQYKLATLLLVACSLLGWLITRSLRSIESGSPKESIRLFDASDQLRQALKSVHLQRINARDHVRNATATSDFNRRRELVNEALECLRKAEAEAEAIRNLPGEEEESIDFLVDALHTKIAEESNQARSMLK